MARPLTVKREGSGTLACRLRAGENVSQSAFCTAFIRDAARSGRYSPGTSYWGMRQFKDRRIGSNVEGVRPQIWILLRAIAGGFRMSTKSDSYALRTFDFFERIKGLSQSEEIGSALIAELKSFGFEYVSVWTMPPAGCPLRGIMLNTRPEGYVTRYVEQNYVLRDPVVKYLRRSLRPYSWGDVRTKLPMTVQEGRIIEEAREFDVYDGLIIPIITATGALSIVSPCGRQPDLSDRARAAVEIIGVMGQQALKRAHLQSPPSDEAVRPLTAREREILQFIASGKSDSEIAIILNISAVTVLAHVENAKRKLGAAKRTLAIVVALQRGELNL